MRSGIDQEAVTGFSHRHFQAEMEAHRGSEAFSDRRFGEDVARPTVLTGGTAADQIEYFSGRERIDLIW
jgi:hypothetical protein